jgi:hypothetical protein
MPAVIQNRVNQLRMIENGIARFDIAQKIDQRNLVSLRTRKRANDEIEISRSKPRPTIRSDHRDFIMRDVRSYGKSDILSHTDFHESIRKPGNDSSPSFDPHQIFAHSNA